MQINGMKEPRKKVTAEAGDSIQQVKNDYMIDLKTLFKEKERDKDLIKTLVGLKTRNKDLVPVD